MSFLLCAGGSGVCAGLPVRLDTAQLQDMGRPAAARKVSAPRRPCVDFQVWNTNEERFARVRIRTYLQTTCSQSLGTLDTFEHLLNGLNMPPINGVAAQEPHLWRKNIDYFRMCTTLSSVSNI